jgi:signal peptidase II
VVPTRDRKVLGNQRRAIRAAFALACLALLFGADLATKHWAETELRRHGARSALSGVLILRYQTNSGIAFGIGRAPIIPWKRHALIAYGAAISVGLAVVLGLRLHDPRAGKLTLAGLIALLAGATGNLRDRLSRGAVIDFLDIQPPGGPPWPAFNLADLYLAVGLGLCALGLIAAQRSAQD